VLVTSVVGFAPATVLIMISGTKVAYFFPLRSLTFECACSARIRKGPAPLNMEIPPYKFLTEDKLLIG
jgi:hypothetical protein